MHHLDVIPNTWDLERDRVVAILALLELGYSRTAPATIGRLVGRPTEKVEAVLRDRNLRRRYAARLLHPGVHATITRAIRCPECGSSITVVPCASCRLAKWSTWRPREECRPSDVYDPIMEPPDDCWDIEPPRSHPCEPTDSTPGSCERIEVYRERYERGEHLFHDDDLRVEQ